jgi:short-subunit dehydrogenase
MENFYSFDNSAIQNDSDAFLKSQKNKSAKKYDPNAISNPSDDSAAIFDSGSGFSRDSVFSPAFDDSAAVFDSGSGFSRDGVFTPDSVDSAYKNDDSILDAGSGFDSSIPDYPAYKNDARTTDKTPNSDLKNDASIPRESLNSVPKNDASMPRNFLNSDHKNGGSIPRKNPNPNSEKTEDSNILPDEITAEMNADSQKPDWHSDKIAEDSRADGFALNIDQNPKPAARASGISLNDDLNKTAKKTNDTPAETTSDANSETINNTNNINSETANIANSETTNDASDANFKTPNKTNDGSKQSAKNAPSKSPFAAVSPNSWTLPESTFADVLKAANHTENDGIDPSFLCRSNFINSRDFEAATLDGELEKNVLDGSKLNPDGYAEVIEANAPNHYETTAENPKKTAPKIYAESIDLNYSESISPASESSSKTVFIIGASDGIGAQTAALFLEKGYSVYNGSRTPSTVQGVKNLTVDAANPHTVDAAVDEILRAENKINVFVYSAGFSLSAPFENTEEEDYRYLFDVNFFGFVRAARALIPSMRENGGGKILAISSMGGIFPIAFDGFYSASKAALNMLIRSLSLEVAPYNIKVSAILPGGTATNFTRKRKVYPPEMTGVYEHKMMKANSSLAAAEQNGMPAHKVAESVAAAAESENPPLTNAVGPMNKVLSAADKILPENVANMLIKKKYRL